MMLPVLAAAVTPHDIPPAPPRRYFIGASRKEVVARVCSCDVYRNGAAIMIPFNANVREPSETEKVGGRGWHVGEHICLLWLSS